MTSLCLAFMLIPCRMRPTSAVGAQSLSLSHSAQCHQRTPNCLRVINVARTIRNPTVKPSRPVLRASATRPLCQRGMERVGILVILLSAPFSSDRQHLSYGDCLEVRGEIIRTVLCCIVYWKLCTVISTLRWAVLTVLWIGFCLTGPISLCVDSCVYVFFALYCLTANVLYYCNTVGWTW